MATIKFINRDYSYENTFFQDKNIDVFMMEYICNGEKTKGYIGTRNLMCAPPGALAMQFQTVRNLYHKNSGRLLRHIVISFEPHQVYIQEAQEVAYICASFFNDYQVVYAVHSSTSHIHIHFLVNTVSFVDGHKYSGGYADLRQFINYANSAIDGIDFEECSAVESE